MENQNQPVSEEAPESGVKKNHLSVITVFAVFVVTALVLVAVGFLSRWECAGGKWIRRGLPLSGQPQGQCANESAAEIKKEIQSESESVLEEVEKITPIAEEIFKTEDLEIWTPRSASEVSSPVSVKGRAKGTWFFEGSFPLKLADENGNVFAESHASAEGEWMTENWVNFSGTVQFLPEKAGRSGFLILEKDNPSGRPDLDSAVSVPVKFSAETVTENVEPSPNIAGQCGHDPKDDPILGDCGEDCDTQTWKTYKSQKYGYSFRYPNDFVLTKNCKKGNCVIEENGGDLVTLSGDLSEKGWPMVEIRHLSSAAYNPPESASLPEWIKEKFPGTEKCFPNTANIYFTGKEGHLFGGFNLFFPASPQAYSRREIYYLQQGKIFQIIFLDAIAPQARQFYDIWLASFSAV